MFLSLYFKFKISHSAPAQFGKINYANDDVGCENLEDEIMRLCAEIENINGNNIGAGNAITNDDNADEMVDLNFNEEKLLRNIMDRVSLPTSTSFQFKFCLCQC